MHVADSESCGAKLADNMATLGASKGMILSQPHAWSAEPSGLLSGPYHHCLLVPRIMPPVLGRVRGGSSAMGGSYMYIKG